MLKNQLFSIVDSIIDRGLGLLNQYFQTTYPIDYVAIFAKDNREKRAFIDKDKNLKIHLLIF